jgi:signal transduction histidine kinase/ActR/RegA family two-component response regulator
VAELTRSSDHRAQRVRDSARRAIAAFPLPVALLERVRARTPIINDAWRSLFGTASLPSRIHDSLDALDDEPAYVADVEVRMPTHVGYFTVTLRSLPESREALAIGFDSTDDVIRRLFELSPALLVWHRDAPNEGGHYNRVWRTRIGASWTDALHHGDLARWQTALAETERGHLPAELDLRLRISDGTFRWHRIRLLSAGPRVVCCASDVHALRRRELERNLLLSHARSARADAAAANRIKDEFLMAVSHELRAPLTTMLLWERVLRESANDEEARLKALDAIHQSATAQARLVADLLDFARGLGGKLFLDIRHVDLARLARDAVEAARPLADAKSLELVIADPSFSGEVSADATRLRQVLDNLLSNAIKFTPASGRVVVSVHRRGAFITVAVADTGRGISPDMLGRIFKPFTQADDATVKGEGGLGLGLTISKQLAELHRGTLIATSDGLGHGATLTLSLPVAGTRRAPMPPAGTRPTPKLDGARVLVIDDDDHVRTALAVLLGRIGAIVDTAESAAAGHIRMSVAEPHVVICDVGMPHEDGYSFVRSLRAAGCKIPSVALTAHATHVDAQRALDAGFNVHLAKPVSIERLVDTLSALLTTHRLSNDRIT